MKFLACRGHFYELQLKGNLFDFPQNKTVARLKHNKNKCVEMFLISEIDFA